MQRAVASSASAGARRSATVTRAGRTIPACTEHDVATRPARGLQRRGVVLAGVLAAVALAIFPATSPAGQLLYQQILTNGATDGEPLPIVVALHGLGDRPDAFRMTVDDLDVRARVIVPQAPLPQGSEGYSWFDFHSDNDDQLAAGVRTAANAVAELITSLLALHAGPRRVIVTGFSQGGMLSFALAASHPEIVAAAIPVSGFLPPALWPAKRPEVRPLPGILALHGDADPVVPIDSARWTVEALRSNGYEAELRTYGGVRHSMTKEMRIAMHEAIKAAIAKLGLPQGSGAAPSASQTAPAAGVPAAP